jgi:hypothetical protein
MKSLQGSGKKKRSILVTPELTGVMQHPEVGAETPKPMLVAKLQVSLG